MLLKQEACHREGTEARLSGVAARAPQNRSNQAVKAVRLKGALRGTKVRVKDWREGTITARVTFSSHAPRGFGT